MNLYEAAMFAAGVEYLICARCGAKMKETHGEVALAAHVEHDPYVWFFCKDCWPIVSVCMGKTMAELEVKGGLEWYQAVRARLLASSGKS